MMQRSHILNILALSLLLGSQAIAQMAQPYGPKAPAVSPPPADASPAGKEQSEKAKDEQLFPNATRSEPDLKPSKGMIKNLQQLHVLADAKSNDEVIALAATVIADSSANHYDRAAAYQETAYAYISKGDYVRGAENFEKTLAENALSNNQQYQIMLQLAQTQLNAGQGDAALATVARLVSETKLDKPEYNAVRGRAYYQQKNYAAAAQSLQKAVDGAKPDDNSMQLLMVSYVELKQPERAEKIGLDMLHKHPDDKNSILNLAAIYQQAGQNDKAAATLEDARNRGLLTEAKDYRELYAIYSGIPGKDSQTIAVINEGMQKGILQPDAEAYTKLAESYYALNQPAQTVEAYRKADALSKDGEAALNLAKVLFNQARYAEARTAAQQAQQKGLKQPADASKLLAQIDSAGGKNANKVTKKKK